MTELRGTRRTASDSLVNTYRIQEKNLYLKCFLSTYTYAYANPEAG